MFGLFLMARNMDTRSRALDETETELTSTKTEIAITRADKGPQEEGAVEHDRAVAERLILHAHGGQRGELSVALQGTPQR